MYKITMLGMAVLLLGSCNSDTSKPTDTAADSATAEQPVITDKHNDLFVGWHRYGGGPVTGWKAEDGVLYLDPAAKIKGDDRANDLVSDDEYDNFDLSLEWKIAAKGNSGIIFYSHEDTVAYKRPYETGPEMQIVDNEGHDDGKIVKHMAGDLYDLIACSKKTVKPAGEWNLAEIKSLNGKLDLYLNGENVVSTTLWDDNWNKMVRGSKFKTMPGFGTYKKGHIVLQDHGDMVSFRNIHIKKL